MRKWKVVQCVLSDLEVVLNDLERNHWVMECMDTPDCLNYVIASSKERDWQDIEPGAENDDE